MLDSYATNSRSWVGRLTPPLSELLSPQCAASASNNCDNNKDSTGLWRDFFENPTTVQFDHRLLATTTSIATVLLFLSSRHAARITAAAFAMANVQFALGIATLLYLVPAPLAAAHPGG
jgi:cytochrome c oxidase assembly protein subunit 15